MIQLVEGAHVANSELQLACGHQNLELIIMCGTYQCGIVKMMVLRLGCNEQHVTFMCGTASDESILLPAGNEAASAMLPSLVSQHPRCRLRSSTRAAGAFARRASRNPFASGFAEVLKLATVSPRRRENRAPGRFLRISRLIGPFIGQRRSEGCQGLCVVECLFCRANAHIST